MILIAITKIWDYVELILDLDEFAYYVEKEGQYYVYGCGAGVKAA